MDQSVINITINLLDLYYSNYRKNGVNSLISCIIVTIQHNKIDKKPIRKSTRMFEQENREHNYRKSKLLT